MKKLILIFAALIWPQITWAQISPADTGLYETGNPIYGQPPADIGAYIGTNLINPAFGILGTLFLVLIIYGGFMWMTARGESGPVEKAQKILTNAIIGLVIVIVAYALTRFVLAGLTGQL